LIQSNSIFGDNKLFILKGIEQLEKAIAKAKKIRPRVEWLSDKALKILQGRISNCKDEYLFPKNNKGTAAPIFQVNKIHTKTVNRIGLKFILYDCRHTFATRVLENGTDLLTLASLLGHANLNQVMRYAHPSESRKNDAIKQMQGKKQKQSKKGS
jgi:integrase